jgi:hypothetical protein
MARISQGQKKPDSNFRLLFNTSEPIVVSVTDEKIICGCNALTACLTDEQVADLMALVGCWLQAVDGFNPIIPRERIEALWVILFH